MLCDLRIRDLLLIDELELHLEPGFNVMTGETGAGKSVVIGALGLVLGGRSRPDLVRPGRQEAEVEALFDLSDSPALQKQLEEAGLGDGSELAIRRVVQANGRSRAYLNGRLSAATELANLAPLLVDIASQHESVSLTDPSTHLSYLDAFGGLDDTRTALSALVESAKDLSKRIVDLEQLARGRSDRDAFLRFQLNSIDEVSPKAGEMDGLRTERSKLRGASKLSDSARRASSRLSEADSCICDDLRSIVVDLRSACDLDPSLQDVLSAVENAQESLSDAGRDLARYAEHVHDDPNRLEQIEERLFLLEKLLRQHGSSEQAVLEARDRLAKELDELERVDGNISELRDAFKQALTSAASSAKKLSVRRTKIADSLGAAISKELASLGMGGAKVVVEIAPLDGAVGDLAVDGARLSRDGIDRVEFLIAPNKGIAPRPLRKIASGGELSRALLALKRVLASKGPAGLYVFDEVDTGVGGAVAEQIGRALADVSSHRQVLCITHLAPIAALANAHFVVEKCQNSELATSNVRRFIGKERIREVARMLSGAKVTDAAVTAAMEMVREGRGAVDAQAV